MGYFGSKATTGLSQLLNALMSPHSVYIESHLGGGAADEAQAAGRAFNRDRRDERTLEAFAYRLLKNSWCVWLRYDRSK